MEKRREGEKESSNESPDYFEWGQSVFTSILTEMRDRRREKIIKQLNEFVGLLKTVFKRSSGFVVENLLF